MSNQPSGSARNLIPGLVILLSIVTAFILMIYSPMILAEGESGGVSYLRTIFFFGHWKNIEDGILITEGGAAELAGFPIAASILLLAGFGLGLLSLSSFGVALGGRRQKDKNRLRVSSSVTTLSGVLGFIGTMLFLPYLGQLQQTDPNYRLSRGFIFGLIIFSLLFLAGIPLAVKPEMALRKLESNDEPEASTKLEGSIIDTKAEDDGKPTIEFEKK